MNLIKKTSTFYLLGMFYLICSLILRISLLFNPITQTPFHFIELVKIFTIGLFSDVFIFVLLSVFLWLYLIFISNSKYYKPYGSIIFVILIALLLYIASGKSILNEYGGALPKIVLIFCKHKDNPIWNISLCSKIPKSSTLLDVLVCSISICCTYTSKRNK